MPTTSEPNAAVAAGRLSPPGSTEAEGVGAGSVVSGSVVSGSVVSGSVVAGSVVAGPVVVGGSVVVLATSVVVVGAAVAAVVGTVVVVLCGPEVVVGDDSRALAVEQPAAATISAATSPRRTVPLVPHVPLADPVITPDERYALGVRKTRRAEIRFPDRFPWSTQPCVTDSTLHIALWLERRLDMSLGFHLPASRLYGIVVNDPSGLHDDNSSAARSSFIEEHRDVYEMIGGAPGVLARSFDAAAVVTVGWAAPLDEDGMLGTRASRHPDRRRVRAVAVVNDDGVASVIRFEDDPGRSFAQSERGTGEIVDALEVMWFGDPTQMVSRLVNMRTTRGGCTRWP